MRDGALRTPRSANPWLLAAWRERGTSVNTRRRPPARSPHRRPRTAVTHRRRRSGPAPVLDPGMKVEVPASRRARTATNARCPSGCGDSAAARTSCRRSGPRSSQISHADRGTDQRQEASVGAMARSNVANRRRMLGESLRTAPPCSTHAWKSNSPPLVAPGRRRTPIRRSEAMPRRARNHHRVTERWRQFAGQGPLLAAASTTQAIRRARSSSVPCPALAAPDPTVRASRC